MYLNVEKLNEKAILPTRGSEKAAGWDLYANIDEPIVIQPGEMVKISSGIAIEFNIPEVQVYLNELGDVLNLEKREHNESHRLIESFMIVVVSSFV